MSDAQQVCESGGRLARLLPPGPRPRAAAALLATGFLVTILMGLLSDCVPEADDVTHHLFARFAWHDVRYLLDNWGRPGFTVLHVPLAPLGLVGSRLTSAALSAACAWLAYLVAVRLGLRRAYLVPALTYVQPMFTRLAYASMTETALAFYGTLALWLWLTDRRVWSAAVISLAAVTRYEACVWLAVWAVALVAERVRWEKEKGVGVLLPAGPRGASQKRTPTPFSFISVAHGGWRWFLALALLAWAPAVHNLWGRAVLGEFPFVMFLQPEAGVSYGAGSVLHFVVLLPWAIGYGLTPLAACGLFVLPRRPGRAMLVWMVAVYFLTETVIFAFGSYSSGGYARFLVPLTPLMAVAAAAALDHILDAGGVLAHGVPGGTTERVSGVGCQERGVRCRVPGVRVRDAESEVLAPVPWHLTPVLSARHPEPETRNPLSAPVCEPLRGVRRFAWILLAAGAVVCVSGPVERRAVPPVMVWQTFLYAGAAVLGLEMMLVAGLALWRHRRGEAAGAWRALQRGAAVALVLALVQVAARVRPYPLQPIERGLSAAADFVEARYPGRRVMSFHVWYVHRAGRFIPWDRLYPGTPEQVRRRIERAPPGTIVVWDGHFARGAYFDLPYDWLAGRPWLERVWQWPAGGPSRKSGDSMPGSRSDPDDSRPMLSPDFRAVRSSVHGRRAGPGGGGGARAPVVAVFEKTDLPSARRSGDAAP